MPSLLHAFKYRRVFDRFHTASGAYSIHYTDIHISFIERGGRSIEYKNSLVAITGYHCSANVLRVAK